MFWIVTFFLGVISLKNYNLYYNIYPNLSLLYSYNYSKICWLDPQGSGTFVLSVGPQSFQLFNSNLWRFHLILHICFGFIKGLGCQKALGMESGAISDGQISASSESEWSVNHAANQGRLHFQKTTSKAGSWSAARNDEYQWLQVDMESDYTKVTRVATQGRNGYSQWVKEYKLQYRNYTVNFLYYIEPGQNTEKVKYFLTSTFINQLSVYFTQFLGVYLSSGCCFLLKINVNSSCWRPISPSNASLH